MLVDGGEVAEVTGWVNASGPRDYNLLHDHGDSDWSAVYFAQEGGSTEDGGALLLRTQLAPFTHDCGVFPIAPKKGHLWLFPGKQQGLLLYFIHQITLLLDINTRLRTSRRHASHPQQQNNA
jgi:hypothetical protein